MGVRAVGPGIPRVEDRRDPRERAQPHAPSKDGDDGDREEEPEGRPSPSDDDDADPERLVDVRVLPFLPTGQLLPPSVRAETPR